MAGSAWLRRSFQWPRWRTGRLWPSAPPHRTVLYISSARTCLRTSQVSSATRQTSLCCGQRFAHFHAEYQGQQATFLVTGEVLAGAIRSGTARRLIREWAAEHRAELETNWARMKAGQALERIRPLE